MVTIFLFLIIFSCLVGLVLWILDDSEQDPRILNLLNSIRDSEIRISDIQRIKKLKEKQSSQSTIEV